MSAERLLLVGGWGHHYLAELVGLTDRFDVAVAGDGVDAMAELRVQAIEGARWYDDADEALADFEPDLASIGGVYGRNGHWLRRCLESGVPAVCDKPLAATQAELTELEALATESGLSFATELPLRCDAAMRTARQLVAAGAVGEPVLASAQKSYKFGAFRPEWYADRELYTGTVLWIASHGLDLIPYVTGLAATAVGGHSGNVTRPEFGSMEDHTVTVLALANGGSGVVHADYLRPEGAPTHGDDRLRVAGSRGVVEVRAGHCLLVDDDGGPRDVTDESLGLDVAETLLDAVRGDGSVYTTTDSLTLARLALEARAASEG